jgi:hypothetical protein
MAIWIGGFVLAAALYAVGPDRFLDVCIALYDSIEAGFRHISLMLGAQVYGVVRALAIALYVVFAVLAFLAGQRGHRALGALLIVTVMFLILVWRPYADFPAPLGRWVVALVLVLVAAVMMTQRLTGVPVRRDGTWPPGPPSRPL